MENSFKAFQGMTLDNSTYDERMEIYSLLQGRQLMFNPHKIDEKNLQICGFYYSPMWSQFIISYTGGIKTKKLTYSDFKTILTTETLETN